MNRRGRDSIGFRDRDWRRWWDGAIAIMAICGCVAWLWALGDSGRALHATIQLEHFAASLEHTRSIAPDTERDLERMLELPFYDCAQVSCSASVRARNSAVRARLITLLATKTRSDTIAAGPVQVIEPR